MGRSQQMARPLTPGNDRSVGECCDTSTKRDGSHQATQGEIGFVIEACAQTCELNAVVEAVRSGRLRQQHAGASGRCHVAGLAALEI